MMAERAPPTHHAPEEALFDAATASLDSALALAIDCHLAACARCLGEYRRLAAVGGALLEAEPPQPLAAGALERVLARLDEAPAEPPEALDATALRALLPFDPPAPLARALASVRRPRWRYLAPGTGGLDVPLAGTSSTAHLLRLRPGLQIPPHDHEAIEATVVFSGALRDEGTRLTSGDILVRRPGDRHALVVERPDLCVALVVNAGRLVPLTLKGRLLKLVARP